jgi:hypothetical protein
MRIIQRLIPMCLYYSDTILTKGFQFEGQYVRKKECQIGLGLVQSISNLLKYTQSDVHSNENQQNASTSAPDADRVKIKRNFGLMFDVSDNSPVSEAIFSIRDAIRQ